MGKAETGWLFQAGEGSWISHQQMECWVVDRGEEMEPDTSWWYPGVLGWLCDACIPNFLSCLCWILNSVLLKLDLRVKWGEKEKQWNI